MPTTVNTLIQHLLSLPPASAAYCRRYGFRSELDLFITSDPPERNLGSGGGSAHLLAEAFKASPSEQSFDAWLDTSRKLLIHGSGESRRLPGYAVLGKPLIPVPPLPHRIGNHPDQRLLDLQIECYDRLFWHAPDVYPIMITCGDVLLGYRGPLPVIPGADVCIFGLQSTPEEAMHHGVMFCKKDQPASLEFFLQKPDPDEVRRLAPTHDYFLDTGAWVLSRRALYSMMRKSGWNDSTDTFGDTGPLVADLYGGIGPALGRDPHQQDPELSGLRCTVIPLPEGRFYHFGSNRSLLASTRELVEPSNDKRTLGHNTLPGRTLVVRDSRVGPHAASRRLQCVDRQLNDLRVPHHHEASCAYQSPRISMAHRARGRRMLRCSATWE